jgi:hypothetical protein
MRAEKALGLFHRFELTHSPLPHPCRRVRQFSPVVGVLLCIVNCLWNKLSMCNAVASKLVRHNLSRLTAVSAK